MRAESAGRRLGLDRGILINLVVTLAAARTKVLANARAVAEGRDPRDRCNRAPTFKDG